MPPIYINGQEVVKRYVGISEVVAAYVGAQQVFSSGFDPASLFASGEKGFAFDFFDKSRLYQNLNGTGAVVSDADPVGYAVDLSGNNNHAVAPSTGDRPLYYGYADFDGSGDRLVTPSINMGAALGMTLVVGVRKDAAGLGMVAESDQNGTQSGFWLCSDAGTDNYELCIKNVAGPTVRLNGIAAPSRNLITAKFNLNGTDSLTEIVTRLDGSLVTPTVHVNSNSTPVGFLNNPVVIGGRPGGAAQSLNGRIYRIILIGRLLSDSEILAAEAWVNQSFM